MIPVAMSLSSVSDIFPTVFAPHRSGKVGKELSPEEWHEMMDKEEGATLLDCRNS